MGDKRDGLPWLRTLAALSEDQSSQLPYQVDHGGEQDLRAKQEIVDTENESYKIRIHKFPLLTCRRHTTMDYMLETYILTFGAPQSIHFHILKTKMLG